MRFLTLLALGLCFVGSISALPVTKTDDALIIDQIVDVAQVQAIIQELIEHGKQISAQVVQQLIEVAKGAAKEMLLKILEKLLESGNTAQVKSLPTALIIDQIVDVAQVQAIIRELIEHGKQISAQVVQQLIEVAKGAAKEMLEKILETLVEQETSSQYFISGIIGNDLVQRIITTIRNFGKEAGIKLLNSLINSAKGIVKDALQQLLDQLEETGTVDPQAYIIDQIVDVAQVQAIIQELIEHGKQISAQVVQQLIEVAKGAAKEMLLKILEKLLESGNTAQAKSLPTALIIDQIVDVAQVQAIIRELIEHGKQISAQVVQQLIEVAKGAAKEMLEKILESLLQQEKQQAYIIDRIIDPAVIQNIIDTIREEGTAAGIHVIKQLLQTAKGLLKDLLESLLSRLEGSSGADQVSEAYIIDRIIDPALIQSIIDTIREEGTAAGIHIIKQLLQTAKGLLKDMLENLLARLEGSGGQTFIIDRIIDPALIQSIINTIKEEGAAAGIQIIKDLLKTAKGLLRDLLENLLARLEGSGSVEAFGDNVNIVNIVNIQQIQQIINQLVEMGKGIGNDALKQILEIAKGAAKQMLQKILEQMSGQDAPFSATLLPTPLIIDQIIDVAQVQQILNELLEHGQRITAAAVQQLIDIAKGAAREMLLKILEKLLENGV